MVVGKPKPHLFRMALQRIGLPATQVAMLGDSLATDIAGRRGAGPRTVWFAPAGPPPNPDAVPDPIASHLPDLLTLV